MKNLFNWFRKTELTPETVRKITEESWKKRLLEKKQKEESNYKYCIESINDEILEHAKLGNSSVNITLSSDKIRKRVSDHYKNLGYNVSSYYDGSLPVLIINWDSIEQLNKYASDAEYK